MAWLLWFITLPKDTGKITVRTPYGIEENGGRLMAPLILYYYTR